MATFIESGRTLINVEDIRKVELLPDDIYLGLFPKNNKGEITVDYISFEIAKVHTFDGSIKTISMDLFPPEDGETSEHWRKRNTAYYNESHAEILRALEVSNGVIKVDGFEYGF